jgi:hypothetical protein
MTKECRWATKVRGKRPIRLVAGDVDESSLLVAVARQESQDDLRLEQHWGHLKPGARR